MQPQQKSSQTDKNTNKDTRGEDTQRDLSTHSLSKANSNDSGWHGKSLGRFQLEVELGRGAFGVVYRAVDPQLVRTVALKLPSFSALDSERQAARFLREARAAANLHHPNIVAVYDAGSIGSQHYIASAFIDGSTLRQTIRSRGKPTPTSAAKLVAKLADALNYAHRAGVVHRDIKPENILIDSQGNPFIADFGLARFEAADNLQTREGTLLGTPAYMSPEQAQGKTASIDGRADIWSLGVILYELLAGERPFQGNEIQTLYAVLHTEPPKLGSKSPALPRDLVTITEKCLRKEAGERYATAEALRDDLQAWLNDDPIAARKSSAIERLARWRRRNPTIAVMSLILLLAISVGTSLVSLQWLRAESMRELAVKNALESKEQQKIAEQRSQQLAEQNLVIDQKNAELEKEKKSLQSANEEIASQLKLLTQKDTQLASTSQEKSKAEQLAAQESEMRVKEAQKNSRLRYLGEIYSASLALQARDLSTCDQLLQATQPVERSLEYSILKQQLTRLSQYEPAMDVVDLPAEQRDFFLSSHTPIGISESNFPELIKSRWVSDVSSDGTAILGMQPVPDWFRTQMRDPIDLRQGSVNYNQYSKFPPIFACKVRSYSSAALQAWISPNAEFLMALVPRIELIERTEGKSVSEVHVDFKFIRLREGRDQLLATYSIGTFTTTNFGNLIVGIQTYVPRIVAISANSMRFAIYSPQNKSLVLWENGGSDLNLAKKIELDRTVSGSINSRPMIFLERGLALAHTRGVDIFEPSSLELLATSKFSESFAQNSEVHFSSSKQTIFCIDPQNGSYVIKSIDGGSSLAKGTLPSINKQSLILHEPVLQRISNLARPVIDWSSCRFEQAPDNGWFCMRISGATPRVIVQRRQSTTNTQRVFQKLDIDSQANRLKVSNDGQWCAACAEQELTVFSLFEGEENRSLVKKIRSTDGPIWDAIFTPNRNAIAFVNEQCLLTANTADATQKEILRSTNLRSLFPIENSELVVVSEGNGSIEICDLSSKGNRRSVKVQRSGAPKVVVDSQSQWMVAGGSELALRRWNFLTNTLDGLVRIESPVAALKLFEKHKLLTCELIDGSILLFQWPTLERICRLPAQPSKTLDYCPNADGKRILLATSDKVAVFDVATSMELMTVTSFSQDVVDAKFVRDGHDIVTLQKRGVVSSHQLYD